MLLAGGGEGGFSAGGLFPGCAGCSSTGGTGWPAGLTGGWEGCSTLGAGLAGRRCTDLAGTSPVAGAGGPCGAAALASDST